MIGNIKEQELQKLSRKPLEHLQLNLGNLCNQACSHCHVAASPNGNKIMDADTANRIMQKIKSLPPSLNIKEVEITGGAPEMNSNFKRFIEFFASIGMQPVVRTNLTILSDPEYSDLVEFYQKYNVKLVASLPEVDAGLTDLQRGSGTYAASVRVLQKLNGAGYGNGPLQIDVAANPVGAAIPISQQAMETNFRTALAEKHGVVFNNLISMANNPISRYKNYLKKTNQFEKYMRLLKDNYNPDTLENLMCRSLVSVDYQGNVYDCDFSQAENNKIPGYESTKFWDIDFENFAPDIVWYDYCYACTAGKGSSCYGALSCSPSDTLDFKNNAKNYYGNLIQKTSDLVTAACCDPSSLPDYIKPVLALIDHEITDKYYGCGSPLPAALDGRKVVDLGCGTGRDIYLASKLTGENGFCTGIDMTENQIEVAKKHIANMTEKYGYKKPNVEFIHDAIEDLDKHFEENSIDIVISNCVMNLLEDKETVLKKVFRILKNGGEFYFSDVYADRRLPDKVKNDPVLHGECLGGALYINDFIRAAGRSGFADPRVISENEIAIDTPGVKELTQNARFYSITYRLWKIDNLEDKCEDYGHIAVYKGGLKENPYAFTLDASHVFEKNKPERVCGNTALMLNRTRFAPYFEIIGSFDEHFGEFADCDTQGATERTGPLNGCGC